MLVSSLNKYLPEAGACVACLKDSKGPRVVSTGVVAESDGEMTVGAKETCLVRHGKELGIHSKEVGKPVEGSEHLS